MRRALAIFLALTFGLGPCVALLQASEDTRVPICCRRNGAHHCAMSGEASAPTAAAEQQTAPTIAASTHCPDYPGSVPARITTVHALAPIQATILGLTAQRRRQIVSSPAANRNQVSTHTVRGPPARRFS